ncbi:MAG: 23S rRNA (guanosine(2251)-2'-O)-methyltransferase RlmB [Christensenellaceae bacterium]|nr:23S rRNA (guanosine(2251)-2'-O)-methyltransferase RlmB [Christensenellaceae bacterium]MDD6926299.1 23S rRNA (guanosine(2251)-2'-O)-methyltransferase RlmB [bacterium]
MKIEGRNAVSEAVKSGKTIDRVLVKNGLRDDASQNLIKEIKNKGIKIHFADKITLDKESFSGRHQGFIAFVSDFKYSEIEDILSSPKGEYPFIVVLDGVEDPHNLGSIIRVCECAGVDGLIIGKHRSAAVTDTVMRISEGSANHLKIAKAVNINSAIETLKKNGVWVYAVELKGEDIYKSDLKGPLALVIGGEDTGVNKLTREKCDKTLTIPMLGNVNSLNASVACGVAVFEAVRQRISE